MSGVSIGRLALNYIARRIVRLIPAGAAVGCPKMFQTFLSHSVRPLGQITGQHTNKKAPRFHEGLVYLGAWR